MAFESTIEQVHLIYSSEGIASAKEGWQLSEDVDVKEGWLEGLVKGSAKRESQVEYLNYVRRLVDIYERRLAFMEAAQEHARRIGEYALELQQQVDEQAREQARVKEAEDLLEQEFHNLADQWRRETRMLSSDSDIAANFAYYQIIGMGEKALPLIFREMQERGGRWFLALRAITRQNPVSPEDRGNVRRMTQAWLEWGRQHNYVR
jgi:hypothetical protein